MTKLLEIRDQMIRIYGKYESYLYPIVKFVLALILFQTINSRIGYMQRISTLPVALILALLCAILPNYAMIWLAALVVLLDLYVLSMEAALTALVLFAVILLVYFRFAPRDGIAAVLTPICFVLRIPYIMPVGCGLLRQVYSVIAVVCGTIVYFFLDGIHQNESTLLAVSADVDAETALASKFDISVGQLLNNKEMFLFVALFVVTAAVVYLVRRLDVEHAWTLAIISGELIQIAGLFVGYTVLNISGKTLWLLLGNIFSMLIAFGLEFVFMNLDYDRAERVQFEDDEYYYYVKAVPKKLMTTKEVTVKRFGNTSNIGRRIDHRDTALSEEQELNSRKVIARELDVDEDDNLLK